MRTVVFTLLMATSYHLPNDHLKTIMIYGPTAILILTCTNQTFLISYLLAIAHGTGHKLIPFIDENGLNPKYSATVDIIIHLLMMYQAFKFLNRYPFTKRQRLCFNTIAIILWIGHIGNLYAAAVYPLKSNEFAYSSIFSSLSVAYFLVSHIYYTTEKSEWYVPLLLFTAIVHLSHYTWVMVMDTSYIGEMFVNRYFESVFVFSTWFLPR